MTSFSDYVHKHRKLLISILTGLLILVLIFCGIIISIDMAIINFQSKHPVQDYDATLTGDLIHFLPVGSSDAILIESNGHFALVDAGEDSDYPPEKENLASVGFEDYVLNYVKSVAADASGKVYLDFIVGTHAHSDHIGGFDTLLSDADVEVGQVFLKRYNEAQMLPFELEWDNQRVYDQMLNAATARGFTLVQDIPTEAFSLGNFTVKLLNGAYDDRMGLGENDNSLGLLLTKGSQRIFLSGDINNDSGDETALKEELGHIDLLKAGHHAIRGSNTAGYLSAIRPEIIIITNSRAHISSNTLRRFACYGHSASYSCVEYEGIIARVLEEEIDLYRASAEKED